MLVLRGLRLRRPPFELAVDAEVSEPVVGLCGPSGAGKTTLLELVAGLVPPEAGSIEVDGRVLTDVARGVDLPPRARRVGYVPQGDALFPHLSVRRNVFYGARARGGASCVSPERVLDGLEIAPLLDRRVAGLSGGERQRVALGRALLSGPALLLLDEPLTGLDAALKARVLPLLRFVRDELAVPVLYVTHHPDEVLAFCDRVLLMEQGRIAG
jgi:molybdate transport system ATP-binding protein